MKYKKISRIYLSLAFTFAIIMHGAVLSGIMPVTELTTSLAFGVVSPLALLWADARARYEMVTGKRLWL